MVVSNASAVVTPDWLVVVGATGEGSGPGGLRAGHVQQRRLSHRRLGVQHGSRAGGRPREDGSRSHQGRQEGNNNRHRRSVLVNGLQGERGESTKCAESAGEMHASLARYAGECGRIHVASHVSDEGNKSADSCICGGMPRDTLSPSR